MVSYRRTIGRAWEERPPLQALDGLRHPALRESSARRSPVTECATPLGSHLNILHLLSRQWRVTKGGFRAPFHVPCLFAGVEGQVALDHVRGLSKARCLRCLGTVDRPAGAELLRRLREMFCGVGRQRGGAFPSQAANQVAPSRTASAFAHCREASLGWPLPFTARAVRLGLGIHDLDPSVDRHIRRHPCPPRDSSLASITYCASHALSSTARTNPSADPGGRVTFCTRPAHSLQRRNREGMRITTIMNAMQRPVGTSRPTTRFSAHGLGLWLAWGDCPMSLNRGLLAYVGWDPAGFASCGPVRSEEDES